MCPATPASVWNQLRNITAAELCSALKRDGWSPDTKGGSQHIFRKRVSPTEVRRASVHVHPQKTFGAKLLKSLLNDIGWNEEDLRRLKLIK